jgi:hypothetical protein
MAITEIIHSGQEKNPDKLLVSAAHFTEALQELRACEAPCIQGGVMQG